MEARKEKGGIQSMDKELERYLRNNLKHHSRNKDIFKKNFSFGQNEHEKQSIYSDSLEPEVEIKYNEKNEPYIQTARGKPIREKKNNFITKGKYF